MLLTLAGEGLALRWLTLRHGLPSRLARQRLTKRRLAGLTERALAGLTLRLPGLPGLPRCGLALGVRHGRALRRLTLAERLRRPTLRRERLALRRLSLWRLTLWPRPGPWRLARRRPGRLLGGAGIRRAQPWGRARRVRRARHRSRFGLGRRPVPPALRTFWARR
ncbi:hypothetical protein [Labedaea rhizosphaerae]|uniref:hypothetical protein n=1 Tax=Labedaea rhizosphaerae TaxID=598644 RepID=UPI00105BDFE0|nr:hypothetical protein [Labedaea rhizosphaerae]